jgi:hypothetical protein
MGQTSWHKFGHSNVLCQIDRPDQCLRVVSAERGRKRNLRMPSENRKIKDGLLLPLEVGFFSLVK